MEINFPSPAYEGMPHKDAAGRNWVFRNDAWRALDRITKGSLTADNTYVTADTTQYTADNGTV